jgi:hypothetical protein
VQVKVTGKGDHIVAERALRQRKDAKLAGRRSVYKDSLEEVLEEGRMALMQKHAIRKHAGATHVSAPS